MNIIFLSFIYTYFLVKLYERIKVLLFVLVLYGNAKYINSSHESNAQTEKTSVHCHCTADPLKVNNSYCFRICPAFHDTVTESRESALLRDEKMITE